MTGSVCALQGQLVWAGVFRVLSQKGEIPVLCGGEIHEICNGYYVFDICQHRLYTVVPASEA